MALAKVIINNRYILDERLGEGGMGEVFTAHDRLTGEIVALKQVSANPRHLIYASSTADTASLDDLRLALATEFQLLATLRHPNVISVLDYGFEDKRPFYTMQYLPDAQTVLEAGKDQSLSTKLDLILQMLEALTYLHWRGILHRDLKPGNILVVNNHLHLLDFGLSVMADAAHGQVGTLAYMPPEMIKSGIATEASDLYMVGLIAYELLSGEYPYPSLGSSNLINDILMMRPDLSLLKADAEYVEIVERLLRKNPAERYLQASDVINDLKRAMQLPITIDDRAIRESFLQTASFVERDVELNMLQNALQQAVQGTGTSWLIGGESGVGKTRLLEEIRIRALVEGVTVLRGEEVSEGGLPYQLWRLPIRRLVLMSDLNDVDAAVLKQIVPDIDDLLGREIPSMPDVGGEGERGRLIETVLRLFRQHTSPILLILDDLQWATKSREIVRQLTRAITDLPLLIIGSFRNDEAPDLPDSLREMNLMSVTRLSEEGIIELSSSVLGDVGRREEVIDLLQNETEGNVFFLVEVLRALAEDAGGLGAIGQKTLPSYIFAQGIQTIIQRRISRVPDEARPLLLISAVAGRQLDLKLIAHLNGDDELDEWLATCLNAAVLVVNEGQWRFAHDKLREWLLDSLDIEERQIYHRWVAQGIEYVYPHDPAQSRSLAFHWGRADDSLRESQYTIQAGEQALQHNDYKEAIRYFERALNVIPQDDQVAYAKLLILLGDSNAVLGNLTRAKKYLQRGITLAREVESHASVAMALRALGNVAWNQGVYEEAQHLYEESLALYRKVGDPRGIAKSLDRVGFAKSSMGFFDEAKHYDLEGLAIYWALQDRFGIANSLISVGVDEYMQGRHEDAIRRFEESLLIAEEIGDRRGIARALSNMGIVVVFSGQYEDAIRYLQDSLNLARDMDDQPLLAIDLVKMGFAYAGLGDIDEAERYFLDAIRETLVIDLHHFTILEALIGIAGLWLDEGRITEAAAYIGLALGHSATDEEVRQTARPVLSRLQEMLTPEELQEFMNAGQNMNLRRVVREVLGEV